MTPEPIRCPPEVSIANMVLTARQGASRDRTMDEAVKRVLHEYDARSAEEMRLMETLSWPQALARRDDMLISVGAETGTILNLLAKGMQARCILELGTAYGHSTVWLAEAARANGGRVVSLELAQNKVDYARDALKRAGGLDAYVEFHLGSALDTLPRLSGPFDFVLIDLWKDLYVPCLDLIYSKLSAGALVAADNMIYPDFARADAKAYQKHVRGKGMDSVLLTVGSGVELSRRV
jgi:predicted O-methyltransferase YrrM